MKSSRNSKRAASGAPGVNMLITAAALAGTLGGWVLLASGQARAQANAAATPVAAVSQLDPSVTNPVVQPQPTPSLRVVTVPRDAVGPRRPVTITRSSR
jgi:hypothetical protein